MAERAMRPFWIHQFVEYLIGVALVFQGFQDPEPLVPALAGLLVIGNAAIARGPLGAFRFVGRRTHRVLDVVVMAAIAVGALQPWIDVEVTGRAVMLIVLVPLGFLWFYTDWAERPERSARRADRAGATSEELGRSAGRVAGNAFLAGKRALRRRDED
jgi:hypothetical protein